MPLSGHTRPALRHAIAVLALGALHLPAAHAIERISRATGGVASNNESREPAISFDGRYIVYRSFGSNLVANDTNGVSDVFLFDRATAITTRVSQTPGGTQGTAESSFPDISANGDRIVFGSFATNLLPAAATAFSVCYLLDRASNQLSAINLRPNGTVSNTCDRPSIDLAGARVAYASASPDLVANDDNGADVFVRTLSAVASTRVSTNSTGGIANGASGAPQISGDGSRIAFVSSASDLLAGDSNGVDDVFMAAAGGAGMQRLSVGSGQLQASGASNGFALNFDASILGFDSVASNLPGDAPDIESSVYVRLPGADITELASAPQPGAPVREKASLSPSLSETGQFMVFASGDALVPAYTGSGVYVLDLVSGEMALVSVNAGNVPGDGNSFTPKISGDGGWIVFTSQSTNLVPGDSNGVADIFLIKNPLDPRLFADGFEGG